MLYRVLGGKKKIPILKLGFVKESREEEKE